MEGQEKSTNLHMIQCESRDQISRQRQNIWPKLVRNILPFDGFQFSLLIALCQQVLNVLFKPTGSHFFISVIVFHQLDLWARKNKFKFSISVRFWGIFLLQHNNQACHLFQDPHSYGVFSLYLRSCKVAAQPLDINSVNSAITQWLKDGLI